MPLTAAQRIGIENQQAALNKALLGEDTLGVIIRAHIFIEHEIIDFIKARLSPAHALDAIEVDYAGKVKLAIALGLPAEFKAALNFIGTLRNRFAHRLDAAIGKQDADNFEKALGPGKEVAEHSHRLTQQKLHPDAKAVGLRQLEPMDRVILCFVTLWSGLAVAAARAKVST